MTDVARVGPLPPHARTARQRELLEPVLGPAAANLFSTVVRNEELFEAWLPFCMKLLRRSALPRRERELVILRTAGRRRVPYELAHHERIGARAGLTAAEIAAARDGGDAGFAERELTLLRAVDELLDADRFTAGTWSGLRAHYDTAQLVELPMLVGHYALLAMLLNGLEVPLDEKEDA
ncbi:carboxymuconolactone decarboxylase family protein [Actinomadura chibensis]|uniref:Carboxymuconolactone decarboxylase family protein n=1 Tax=Actinomadura chibensis TaxID=392828 RepID=A0A5D0NDJ5_9ACTN|nr:carboxymuconolactone decarboxylase family protein [Actinomadura chibensis]TYB42488.1 carboxymuconolactone decarboxylase family protein [Actinomadura chibensis]